MCSISPLQELDVGHARLTLVFAGQGQHVVGHVEPVGFARRPHAPGRKQHVDAASRAEIQHRLTGAQIDESSWIAAAERSLHGFLRDQALLARAIEVGGNRIAAA
jgi:hypothetical protein